MGPSSAARFGLGPQTPPQSQRGALATGPQTPPTVSAGCLGHGAAVLHCSTMDKSGSIMFGGVWQQERFGRVLWYVPGFCGLTAPTTALVVGRVLCSSCRVTAPGEQQGWIICKLPCFPYLLICCGPRGDLHAVASEQGHACGRRMPSGQESPGRDDYSIASNASARMMGSLAANTGGGAQGEPSINGCPLAGPHAPCLRRTAVGDSLLTPSSPAD